jgi:hypothetical protein
MFVRVKKFSGKRSTRRYLQVAHSYREEGKMRQRVLCTLGRLERLQNEGLDVLIQGLTKFSKNLAVIRASQDNLSFLEQSGYEYILRVKMRQLKGVRKVKAVLLWVKDESYLVRTELKGTAHLSFKAAGLSPPVRVKPLS